MTPDNEHVTDRLQVYVEDELSPDESEKIRRHLQDCPSCRARAQELRDLLALLGTDVASVPLRPVWPSVEEGLRKSESRRVRLVSGLAVAAGLLLAVLIGQRDEPSESSAWSPLGSAFSPTRDTAVAEFGRSTPAEGGLKS